MHPPPATPPQQRDDPRQADVLILGAGAAGLMAAVGAGRVAEAAGRRLRILLVEKNRQAGIKVLVCGGGRGNLTNAGSRDELLRLFGREGRWLTDALARLDNDGVREFFGRLGVPTKVEDDGRVFPVSDRARDLVDALVREADRLGVEVVTGWAASGLLTDPPVAASPSDEGSAELPSSETRPITPGVPRRVCGAVLVPADTPVPARSADASAVPAKWRRFDPATWGHLHRQSDSDQLARQGAGDALRVGARTVVLAVGGASYVRMGTTGDGFRMAERIGLRVIGPRPAVVPLLTVEQWGDALAGVAVPGAAVWIDLPKHKRERSRGDVLFTHFGLSGPAVLNLSDTVALLLSAGTAPVPLVIDLLPEAGAAALEAELTAGPGADGRKGVRGVLSRHVPERLADHLLAAAGGAAGVTIGTLPRAVRRKLVERLKSWPVAVHATKGMAQAMVTGGGIPVRDVDPRTMESRRAAGLYLTGELLDLTGPSGGYNLQLAWSTGLVAGESAARAALAGA